MNIKTFSKFVICFASYLFIALAFNLILASPSHATSIQKVKWATEIWKNVSQRNGEGLYHELIDNVFALEGVEVEKQFVPFKRALKLVEQQGADITGGIRENDMLLLSDTIVLATGISVLYREKHKIDDFSDLQSLIGTWPQIYEKELLTTENLEKLVGFPSSNRATCLNHIITNKADYYLDASGILSNLLIDLAPNAKEDLRIQHIEPIHLKMAFSNTPRGQQIKAIFERGIRRLHHSGKLKEIYRKYHRSYILNL